MEAVQEREAEFGRLVQDIYESGSRQIRPLWPWVLIRVVPKEQKFGSLHLPDIEGEQKQHKPLLEGIVLVTWEPHWSRMRLPGVEDKEKEVWRKSDLKVGDRVLYPHFAGLPVPFLDETKYRLVREWSFDVNGGIVGTLQYKGDKKMKAILDAAFNGVKSITMSGR